jgi:hypothetical protein
MEGRSLEKRIQKLTERITIIQTDYEELRKSTYGHSDL